MDLLTRFTPQNDDKGYEFFLGRVLEFLKRRCVES